MKTFSFVIPCYNHYQLLHTLLFDIYQKCNRNAVTEIIVVDDCSTEDTFAEGIEWWKTNGMLPIRHLRMKQNSGFLKSSNTGLRKATGEVVCLISNDVRIHKDIVSQILSYDPIELLLIGGRLLDWDTGWNKFGNQIFPYIEGWLLAAHTSAWLTMNYLDERFMPNDYEDVDLSTTAISNGFSLVPLPENYTTHLGGQSLGYNPEREKITLTNREKFKDKWIK